MTYRTFDAGPIWRDLGTPVYDRRVAKAEDAGRPYCATCGRALNPATAITVRVVDGGGNVLHPADDAVFDADPEAGAGDMGGWDIGPECGKRIPTEFRR